MPIALAGLLIALGAVTRIIPHPTNFVAMGAIALYAGARLPRRWAFFVPLLAMFASDVILDWGHGFAFFGAVRMTSYATLAAIALLSSLGSDRVGALGRAGMSVGASTAFFLTTNLAVWATPLIGGGALAPLYPLNGSGLLACYAAAIPFFHNTLAADLLGTGVLFGLDALARRWAIGSRMRKLAPAMVSHQTD